MLTKEQLNLEVRKKILYIMYKVFDLRNTYPELSFLQFDSKYKYNPKHSWRATGWSKDISKYISKLPVYEFRKDMARFFNRHLVEPTLNKVMGMAGITNPFDVLAVFKYGSQVYGCTTDKSDFDYVMVKKSGPREEKSVERERVNINIVSLDDFVSDINNCEIAAWECWCLPDKHILRNELPTIAYPSSLDKVKLRHSISEKASHSFVKAKKKFIVPEDRNIYAGKKSLFHSLRIIDFGSQLAKLGKIEYYDAANYLHKEIMDNPSEDWNDYQQKYKPLYNNMMTNFRLLAPKE